MRLTYVYTGFLAAAVVSGGIVNDARADGPAPATPATPAPAAGPPAAPPAAPAAASDEDARRAEASERYRRAVQIFTEGDMKLALIEFRRAYALVPNHQVLYNIGVTADRLGRYAESVQAYEQYLKDGGKDVPAARVEEVQSSLKILRQRTAYLSLLIDEVKADVFLDGEKMGESPLPETLVGAGTHDLRIVKNGFEPNTQSIALAGGDHTAIKVHLVQKKDPVVVGEGGGLGPVWIGWGLTAAGAVATVVSAIAWQGAETDLDALLKKQTTQALLDSAANKAANLRTLTFVVGGATLVAAGVSLVFTILRANNNSKAETKPQAAKIWFDGTALSGKF